MRRPLLAPAVVVCAGAVLAGCGSASPSTPTVPEAAAEKPAPAVLVVEDLGKDDFAVADDDESGSGLGCLDAARPDASLRPLSRSRRAFESEDGAGTPRITSAFYTWRTAKQAANQLDAWADELAGCTSVSVSEGTDTVRLAVRTDRTARPGADQQLTLHAVVETDDTATSAIPAPVQVRFTIVRVGKHASFLGWVDDISPRVDRAKFDAVADVAWARFDAVVHGKQPPAPPGVLADDQSEE